MKGLVCIIALLWGLGGFSAKATLIEENYDLQNEFEEIFGYSDLQSLYKRDTEKLIFIFENRFGFKSSQVLFDNDIDLFMYSDYGILVNLTTNEVIYERNADAKVYPASLTKMITVLVALEHGTQETMTINADFNELAMAGAAIAGFRNGEEVTMMDLLMATMLPSGADASETLAYHIAGSEEKFVELMNETALALGMNETHFTNVTGLHHEDHYTTARDMAILVKMAIKNPDFREIFTTKYYETEKGTPLVFTSRMFDRMDSAAINSGEVLGGKTGYTWEALLCLASFATDGNHEYALVTLHADGGPQTPQFHVIDALEVYNYFLGDRDQLLR